MGQVLIRNLDDDVISSLRFKAQMKGRPLEQELREILTDAAPLTAAEKVAAATRILGMTKGPVPSLSLEEIREGLE